MCSSRAAGSSLCRCPMTLAVGTLGGTMVSRPSPRSSHDHTSGSSCRAVCVILNSASLITRRSSSVRACDPNPTTSLRMTVQFPVQRLRVLRRPLCGRGPVACGRLTSGKAGEGIIAVPGGIFGTAVLELTPHDVEHRWMCADEGREICRPHHQGAHRFQGDHTGGTDADLQRGTFTDQLARSALGENAFPAVLVDADLSAAAEDHDHVICLTTFLDQPGPGRERSRRRDQPERVSLDGVQRLPEDHRGADGSFGSQRRPGRPVR